MNMCTHRYQITNRPLEGRVRVMANNFPPSMPPSPERQELTGQLLGAGKFKASWPLLSNRLLSEWPKSIPVSTERGKSDYQKLLGSKNCHLMLTLGSGRLTRQSCSLEQTHKTNGLNTELK